MLAPVQADKALVAALEALTTLRAKTFAEIKAEPKLKEMILVKYSRLSVQPVKDSEWDLIMKMGGMKTK